MSFISELDPHPLKMYLETKVELYRSRLSKVVLQTYRQTNIQIDWILPITKTIATATLLVIY